MRNLHLKSILITLSACLFLQFNSAGQHIEIVEQNLLKSFKQINYYSDKVALYDSLSPANDAFEKMLLEFTAQYAESINHPFSSLVDKGLRINTSKDNHFRIYTWDDEMGGTMRNAYNVFQYKANGKVFSKSLRMTDSLEEYNIDPFFVQINDLIVGNKTYYITQEVAVESSALYVFAIKIFSIDSNELNDTAKLIKTKNGIRNKLSYAVDWSEATNRDSKLPKETAQIQYDAHNKIISIPLIQADGKITTKRIQYKFNGDYFVKI